MATTGFATRLFSVSLTFFVIACSGGSDEADTGQQPQNYVETIRGTEVQFEMVWVPDAHLWVRAHGYGPA